MSSDGVRVVSDFYRAFVRADLPACLALLADDVVLEPAGSLPYSGTAVGHDGFSATATTMLSLLSRAEPVDWVIDDAGEIVVATSTGTFTSRATGQTLTTPVVEHFWVTDGQIHRIDAYYKDPKSLAPLFDGAAE
jgi:ketosteroid isomerase-like protein